MIQVDESLERSIDYTVEMGLPSGAQKQDTEESTLQLTSLLLPASLGLMEI